MGNQQIGIIRDTKLLRLFHNVWILDNQFTNLT